MRFGTTLLATVVAVIGVIVVLTVGVSSAVLERDARSRLHEELDHVLTAFADVRSLGRSLLRSQAQSIAQEPRLKAVIASADVDRATLLDVAREMQETLGSDVFLVADAKGRLRVDVNAPEADGDDLTQLPGIADALRSGSGSGVWIRGSEGFDVAIQQIAFGNEVVGLLAIGERIDGTIPATVHRQTGATVLLMLDGELLASAPAPIDAEIVELAAGVVRAPADRAAGAGTARYVVRVGPYPGALSGRQLHIVALSSLDEALAASRELSRLLLAIGGFAFVLAIGSAWIVARRLSRPVRLLAEHTREIAGGVLRQRPDLSGPSELVELGHAMNTMAGELAESRHLLGAKERLERELEIATRIQTSILPNTPRIAGLELAAAMEPATEVGGDYYDVLPCSEGGWIAIGDVAGHGVQAGMVMMMMQSALGALAAMHPDATPALLTCSVNRLLYHNIRERMHGDDHVTFTLFRYRTDGSLIFSGAHEDIVLLRRDATVCELVATRGTWLGITPDVSRMMLEDSLALGEGDLVVLYTDGITEAAAPDGTRFGIERLCAIVETTRTEAVEGIRDRVLAGVRAWSPHPDDDLTVVVFRRVEAPAEAA